MSTQELRIRISAKDSASPALARTRAGVESISTSLAQARAAFLAFQGALGLRAGLGAAALADEVGQAQARLAQATRSIEAFGQAQRQALALSAETGAGFRALADLYSRIATAAGGAGLSQQRIAAVTEVTARALRVSGASAAESAAVITQFSQALGAGALRGEEFNSIMENGPRLARALADGLGVPIGRLRDLAEQGALTTDIVVAALESQREAIAREAQALPRTLGAGLAAVRDAAGQTVARLDETSGASAAAGAALAALARNMDTIVAVGLAGAVAAGAVALGRLTAAAQAGVAALVAKVAAERQALAVSVAHQQARVSYAAAELAAAQAAVASAAGMARLTAVQTALAPAQQRLAAAQAGLAAAMAGTSAAARGAAAALAFVGGPVGLLATAVTAGAAAWALWGSRAAAAADRAAGAIERAREAMARLAREQRFGTGDAGALREGIAALEAREGEPRGRTRTIGTPRLGGGAPGRTSQGDELARMRAELARLEAAGEGAPGAPNEAQRLLAQRQWGAYLAQFRDRSQQLAAALSELRERARGAGVSEMSEEFRRAEAAIRERFAARRAQEDGPSFEELLARMAQKRLERYEQAEAEAERERLEQEARFEELLVRMAQKRLELYEQAEGAASAALEAETRRLESVAQQWLDVLEPGRTYVRQLNEIDAAEQRALLSAEEAAQARRRVAEAAERQALALEGAAQAASGADDTARQLGLTFTSALEEAIVSGRKLSDVLRGIAQDVLRIVVRRTVTEPLAQAAGAIDWRAIFRWFGFAAGGVPGGDSVAAWRNRIVERPTFFAFARGGVMGEAGPEAIMPLARTPDGRLGVAALGAGAGSVTVNVVNQAPGTEARASERTDAAGRRVVDVVIDEIRGRLASDIARGAGPLPAALAGTYGLNRVAGATR